MLFFALLYCRVVKVMCDLIRKRQKHKETPNQRDTSKDKKKQNIHVYCIQKHNKMSINIRQKQEAENILLMGFGLLSFNNSKRKNKTAQIFLISYFVFSFSFYAFLCSAIQCSIRSLFIRYSSFNFLLFEGPMCV